MSQSIYLSELELLTTCLPAEELNIGSEMALYNEDLIYPMKDLYHNDMNFIEILNSNYTCKLTNDVDKSNPLLDKLAKHAQQINWLHKFVYTTNFLSQATIISALALTTYCTPVLMAIYLSYEVIKPLAKEHSSIEIFDFKPFVELNLLIGDKINDVIPSPIKEFSVYYIYPIIEPITDYIGNITIDDIAKNALWSTIYFKYYSTINPQLEQYNSFIRISHTVFVGLAAKAEHVNRIIASTFNLDSTPLNELPSTAQIIGDYTEEILDISSTAIFGEMKTLGSYFGKKLLSKSGKVITSVMYEYNIEQKLNDENNPFLNDNSFRIANTILKKMAASMAKKQAVSDFKTNRMHSLMLPYVVSISSSAMNQFSIFFYNLTKNK